MDKTPNFFVIGVAKGGTTSLYHYLSQHPQVYLSPVKETNHFAMADIDERHLHPVYKNDVALDVERYLLDGMKYPVHIAHINKARHYEALFSRANGQKAIGEISNSYIICPSAVAAIAQKYPEAKLLVMLRNPVKRAWSHFIMNIREAKNTSRDFVTEVMQDHQAIRRGWGVNHQYLALGSYFTQMSRVLNHFPPAQVKWLLYEDFLQQPQEVLNDMLDFLGVDPAFDFSLEHKANEAAVPVSVSLNTALHKSGFVHRLKHLATPGQKEWVKSVLYKKGDALPKMTEEEYRFLAEFYRDEVSGLSGLLSFDFSAYWNIP